jgi:hypothetical protein
VLKPKKSGKTWVIPMKNDETYNYGNRKRV